MLDTVIVLDADIIHITAVFLFSISDPERAAAVAADQQSLERRDEGIFAFSGRAFAVFFEQVLDFIPEFFVDDRFLFTVINVAVVLDFPM